MRGNDMKFHATFTIEKDYDYDKDEWILFSPELTDEQFEDSVKHWITEDFDRIVNRAQNVIGNFQYKLDIGKKENESESVYNKTI